MSATSWKPDTYGSYMKNDPDIRKMGYLKKLKTMKRKFFVLKEDTEEDPAKLEYYDSEKKWRTRANPKRSIVLKTCFNISRKLDTRHKHAIALYTKDDCFTIVLDNDTELEEWLQALLELQHGKEAMGDEVIKPTFEHVWQVNVKSKGIVSTKSISGPHRLCLTAKVLTLVRMNMDNPDIKEFPLSSIRRCGHSDCFFFMELGRSAVTGAGELWMQTEDMIIAQNMHEAILNAMRSSAKEDIVPRQRTRSSSANESSKPINVHSRRQTAVNLSATISTSTPSSRDRCDSMPSRPRTISEGQPCGSTWERFHYSSIIKPSYVPNHETHRPHSMYTHPSHSLPTTSLLPSPGSMQYTTDSCGSSLSMDEHDSSQMDLFLMKFNYSQTPESTHPSKSPITEEALALEDYVSMSPTEFPKRNSEIWESVEEEDYMRMASPGSTSISSPQSIPGASSSGVASATVHSRTPSLSNPPSLLAIGLPSVKACSPPMEGDYLNMASPAASSPSDLDGYLPMSPLGTSFPDIPTKPPTPSKSFSAASPTNSGTKKNSKNTGDGYVPMAPVSASLKNSFDSEGYMDMTPTAHTSKNGKGNPYLEMSPTSATILKSGTPSTDIRFSEYQLEKVRAYFSPSEDDEEGLVRAYSFGSKPESTNRRRSGHLDVFNSDTRTRAFSVGSKVPMQFGKLSSGIGGSASPNSATTDKSKKSSSAPLLGGSKLSSSWSGTCAFFKTYTNSKPNYNEDLMEIDFGNRNQSGRSSDSGGKRSNNSSVESLPRSGRPRSNSKSSTSRSAKHDTLQVIGEKSDVFVPSSELISQRSPSFEEDYMEFPQFSKSKSTMARDEGARLSFRKKDINSNVPVDTSCLITKLEKSKSISSEDYVEMGSKVSNKLVILPLKEQEAKKMQPLKVQVSFPTKDAGSSPPSSGEYVNIDLGKHYQKTPASSSGLSFNSLGSSLRSCNSKTNSVETTNADSKPSESPKATCEFSQFSLNISKPAPNISPHHDYMNLQIGGFKTGSKSSTVSESMISAQGSQNMVAKAKIDETSEEAAIKPGPLKTVQSISRMQKQLSAPTIMSTILSKGGSFMSHRKISSPATLSSPAVVEPLTGLESSAAVSRSINGSQILPSKTFSETVLPVVKSTTKESNQGFDTASAEKPYENICVGKDSKSRPTSVSSERELNYASLDLSPLTLSTPAPLSEEDKLPVSPKVTQTASTSTDEVVEGKAAPSQFSYAEIDFTKSEGLRSTSNTVREIRQ